MPRLDRQLGIITILLRQRRMTARSLAERFGVSTRTIHRDIGTICEAGIPLITLQGASGGIEIMEGYSVDRSVFTVDEIETLICALRGTDSVLGEAYTERFIEKLSERHFTPRLDAPLEIDLADYHASSLSDKIKMIRKGISDRCLLIFTYYNASGDTAREVEPYRLLFRWGTWYLFAFCRLRGDFRLFKLQRLWDLKVGSGHFPFRAEALEPRDWDRCFGGHIHLEAVFDACVRYRLLEEYDPALLTPASDGRFAFSFDFSSSDHLISWLLSFGAHVEVVTPDFIRERVIEQAKILIRRNNHDNQLSGIPEHNERKTEVLEND